MSQIWKIDPSHSEINFRVKHLIISTVSGNFRKFEAQAQTEGQDLENARISFSAETASVSTGNEQRDGHLKSDDFFHSEKFPALSFNSTSFTKTGPEHYLLKGKLTIRDQSRDIELQAAYGGTIKDPWGQTRVGFTVTGALNRSDFGLKWNALMETGGAVVSDEVKLNADIEFVLQP